MKKQKETSFNDLLIPIIIVMAILPFIVYLAMYNCGLGEELWYSDNDIIGDFYCYYKSRLFVFTSAISGLILLIYFILYKEKLPKNKAFLFLAGYILLAVISSVFTVNGTDTLVGSMYHFESIFVLTGYIIIFLYAYIFVNKEQDFCTLGKVFTFSALLLAILGAFQACNLDIFDWKPFIRLITPKEWEEYALENMMDAFSGNNVSLTLYNPNNAGQYLVMILPYFILSAWYSAQKNLKIFYTILSLVLTAILWFSYSRGALLAFGIELILGFFFILQKNKQNFLKMVKFFVIFVIVCGIMFVVLDSTQEFKFAKRLINEKSDTRIEEILTTNKSIQVTYGDFVFETGFVDENNQIFLTCNGTDISQYYEQMHGSINYQGFENIQILPITLDNEQMMLLTIEEFEFSFVYEEGQYLYINDVGKKDDLVSIPAIDFHGLETKGSSRLYLWSRTIPLLKNYIFIGSGADTFYRVFPQNDYIGKKVYTGTCARVMEKPHNAYLMVMIQTGVFSLIFLILFYIWYFKTVISHKDFMEFDKTASIMGNAFFLGTIGYIISSLFYDSSLQCTPLFCVMMGISLSIYKQD